MTARAFIMKLLRVPETNATRQVDAVVLWRVRWTARQGSYGHQTEQRFEAFPVEAEAIAFAESLRAAHRLLRNTGEETKVEVERQ